MHDSNWLFLFHLLCENSKSILLEKRSKHFLYFFCIVMTSNGHIPDIEPLASISSGIPIKLRSVVFPAPEGPRSKHSSPWRTRPEAFLRMMLPPDDHERSLKATKILLSVEGKRRLLCDVCCFMAFGKVSCDATRALTWLTSCHVIALAKFAFLAYPVQIRPFC